MYRKIICVLLTLLFVCSVFTSCNPVTSTNPNRADALSYDDAVKELDAFTQTIGTEDVEPKLDIYNSNSSSQVSALADISVFPLTTKGNGEINIEVAADTEMSDENSPDNWMNIIADRFNRENKEYDGKTVTVSVRKITAGETVTYMTESTYKPDLFVPSSYIYGKMLDASGFKTVKLSNRIAGNTAGILMEKKTHEKFTEKYGKVTLTNVIEASLAGDIVFAYTNPYTSSTGLNMFCGMLNAYDSKNPLSDVAAAKLLEYQKNSPPVGYTTAVLRDQAANGVIQAMVMEEQARFGKQSELKNFVFTPQGIRHDHPVYTFDYTSKEKQEAAKLFVDYCLSKDSQELATEKGFNKYNEYKGQTYPLDGAGYIAAQKLWKQNKDGGRPVIAVFIADISGSMDGLPINSLKESLVSATEFIGEGNHIGLISYSDNVYVNLPIGEFDDTQRAYFSGAVKSFTAGGGTATYNAVLVGLKMLLQKKAEIPDAKLMLFVLSDGDQNQGYALERITPIIGGLQIPIYSIGYNLSSGSQAESELSKISAINEAVLINANSEDLINNLRNLFNVQM